MPDPVPRRCGVRPGLDEHVLLVIPDADVADPYEHGGGGFIGIGVDGYLSQIGGENGFRAGMVGAVASYYASNGPDADPEPIKQRLRQTIVNAPRGGRSDQEIARYVSDRHLNDIIGWVRARERANPRPRNTPSDVTDRLKALATAVPVGSERAPDVRVVATALLRCRSIPPRLTCSLIEAWNQQHCSPPLSREQVRSLVNDLAGRQVKWLERHHAR